jgi:hypothetical protein
VTADKDGTPNHEPARGDGPGVTVGTSDVVSREWDREWERKTTLEQRGITVITSSGALASLVFAITAVITKGTSFGAFKVPEAIFITGSLVLFVGAALHGIRVNRPEQYEIPPVSDFLRLADPPVDVKEQRELTARFARALETTRRVNNEKAELLEAALRWQLAAVVAVGGAALIIMVAAYVHHA